MTSIITSEIDQEIVKRIINRDERALHMLYKKFRPQIFGYIYRRIPQKHIAEEITQDIFIHFLEGLRDFRFQCSIKTFLFAIARNKSIDYMRKKKIKQILFSRLPTFVVEGLTQFVMDDELERKELEQKLATTMQALPHDYRLILRLKYMEDKSVKEISKKLLKTFKSTESLLYRARKAFIDLYKIES
ncbi:MAG: RNA polymerase sigma factor [Candidatus Roizmanbacteria bacterium]|nr:RNA polymerase sigma factor [Candidatus Roizmanbacteria bacterium]